MVTEKKNFLKTNFYVFACLALLLGLGSGCSSSEETITKAPVAVPKEAPEAVVSVLSGKVDLSQFDGVLSAEIFWLESVDEQLKGLLDQQRKLLKDAFSSEVGGASVAQSKGSGSLSESIATFIEDFPEPFSSKFTVDKKRSFKGEGEASQTEVLGLEIDTVVYTSHKNLYERYATHLKKLTADNMLSHLETFNPMLKKDYEEWNRRAGYGDNDPNALQAKANINWLSVVSEHLKSFNDILADYDQSRQRRQLRSGGKPTDAIGRLEDFQMSKGSLVQVEVLKQSVASSEVLEGGDFELISEEGEGQEIVVGLILKAFPDYLVFASAGEKSGYFRLSDLKSEQRKIEEE